MIVEVIGLPAVGKTTLVGNNLSGLESQFKVISSRKYNFANSVLTRVYYCSYRFLTKDRLLAKKIAYRMSFRTFLKPSVRYFFFDSGIYQVLVESLIENNFANLEEVQKLLKHARNPDKLLYIKAPIEEVVDREISRKDRRFPDLGRDELLRRYGLLEQMVEKKELFRHTNMYIVRSSEFMQKINGLSDD